MALHDGQQLFKGLLTAFNEHKDIVQQYLLVTDARDQIRQMAEELNRSRILLGHSHIRYVSCDKPKEERPFWEDVFPDVAREREYLNSLSSSGQRPEVDGCQSFPKHDINMEDVRVFDTAFTINTAVQGLRDVVEALPPSFQYVGLDAEWCVRMNQQDFMGQQRLDVVILSYIFQVQPPTAVLPLIPNAPTNTQPSPNLTPHCHPPSRFNTNHSQSPAHPSPCRLVTMVVRIKGRHLYFKFPV